MTRQDAIRLLRTEQLGDSELMELAKKMGADALERQHLHFVTPKCGKWGVYILGVSVRYVPEISTPWTMCLSEIDPGYCPSCYTPFVSVDIDYEEQTCILRGLKEDEG